MLFRQIQYFQKIVECGSFTEAADQCHISQSAISQQIRSLEDSLGFLLLIRKGRSFEVTPAGRYFYEKSLPIIAQTEKLCAESRKIALNENAVIHLGYLKNYGGHEFRQAVMEFTKKYPKVDVQIMAGTHEELYETLLNETSDLVLNDQRRAFSDEYRNLILTEHKGYIEVPEGSFMASLDFVSVEELADQTCILVTSRGQEETDRDFYRDILGFRGQYIYAYNMEEAHMAVLSGKGFLPVEGSVDSTMPGILKRIPLYRNGKQVYRRYCAFWKQDNSGFYIEEFADILAEQFAKEQD